MRYLLFILSLAIACKQPVKQQHHHDEAAAALSSGTLLRASNHYILSTIPTVHIKTSDEPIEIESYGFITYDTRQAGSIATNVAGRIEKLYVKYRYQEIKKGQKIMDIYSPELLTAQQNLLFLAKNDPDNQLMLSAAKQRLLLLGMSSAQLQQLINTGKTVFTVAVYSNYSGHIHESEASNAMQQTGMKDLSLITEELSLKQGMYVTKGQNLFTIYNPAKAWAVLNIFAGQANMVKTGDKVRVSPETAPDKDFRATINFIEPFFRPDSKTTTARVYYDNSKLNIPIGSQVKATVFAGDRTARWLPQEAVLSLGLDKVVFLKKNDAFIARKIETGIANNKLIQVLNGLTEQDEVAANAQYLVDSESFIRVNQ